MDPLLDWWNGQWYGWWTLTDADNLVTVIKPDANGNPTLNTELFRSINVLKEIRP